MAGGGQDKEGGGNTEATAAVIALIIIILLVGLWMFARPLILYPAFAMDYVSIKVIELIKGLGVGGQQAKAVVTGVFDGRINPKDGVTISEFYGIRSAVGSQTRWVIGFGIICMAGVIAFKMRGQGFQRKFSLGGGEGQDLGLNHYQSTHWKVAAVSAYFDPDGRDANIQPARRATQWMRDNNIEFEDSLLDRDAAEEAFKKQLGEAYTDVANMSLRYKTIAFICVLHMKRDKAALREREALSIAWAAGKDGTKAMEEFVGRYIGNEKHVKSIEKIMKRHAYTNTGLFALLDKAREKGGVLASSDFLWLRYIDRDLHYTLNNCGRRRFHTEAAGAVSHYFAEVGAKTPILEPYVESAIDGLEDYMAEQGLMSLTEFFAEVEED